MEGNDIEERGARPVRDGRLRPRLLGARPVRDGAARARRGAAVLLRRGCRRLPPEPLLPLLVGPGGGRHLHGRAPGGADRGRRSPSWGRAYRTICMRPGRCARRTCWSATGSHPRPRRGAARSHASGHASRTTTDGPRADARRSTPPCRSPFRVRSGRCVHNRTRPPVGLLSIKTVFFNYLQRSARRYGACYTSCREGVMEALIQVGGAVLGLGVSLAAARLALTGVLAATFGRR